MNPTIESTDHVQTLPLTFPVFTLDPEGDDRTQSPFAMEVDQRSGETYALLFTTEEAVRLYCYRRDLKSSARTIRDARELLRLGQQLMSRFQLITRFALNPSGGAGLVHFVQVKDLLFAARDVLSSS